ncbi:hypothetical protein T12_16976 [Trichinella patagoniensis]|uniref:Uncharacterized protein n=1 Tax=Trichinella patagoniensis TaxID=990121 RepID=A0A0V0YWC5_9BILA|nr:hypothetical protein T12_16976 [Trichinella patagoniensis]
MKKLSTLDIAKSYLLQRAYILTSLDQRTELTNERFDPTYPQPFTDLGFLHLSSFFFIDFTKSNSK